MDRVQCFLTGNEPGESDVDGGYTRILTPMFDLSAGDAKVHFALWYANHFGDYPHEELFKLAITNDGGARWPLAYSVGPWIFAGWNEHDFWLSDYAEPTDKVRLRFEVSDSGGDSVVEAGLDDFRVSILQCDPPGTLARPHAENSLGTTCSQDATCPGESKCVEGVCYAPKHRYLSVAWNPVQAPNTARRVSMQGTPVGWVGIPTEHGGVWISQVESLPVYAGWILRVNGLPWST